MTEKKLPEVGDVYKNSHYGMLFRVVKKDAIFYYLESIDTKGITSKCLHNDFFIFFAETEKCQLKYDDLVLDKNDGNVKTVAEIMSGLRGAKTSDDKILSEEETKRFCAQFIETKDQESKPNAVEEKFIEQILIHFRCSLMEMEEMIGQITTAANRIKLTEKFKTHLINALEAEKSTSSDPKREEFYRLTNEIEIEQRGWNRCFKQIMAKFKDDDAQKSTSNEATRDEACEDVSDIDVGQGKKINVDADELIFVFDDREIVIRKTPKSEPENAEQKWIKKLLDIPVETFEAFEMSPEKEKPKSIWRPVSELPELTSYVLIKDYIGRKNIFLYDGNHKLFINILDQNPINQDIISSYCLLTDFINEHEDLKARVERLENINFKK